MTKRMKSLLLICLASLATLVLSSCAQQAKLAPLIEPQLELPLESQEPFQQEGRLSLESHPAPEPAEKSKQITIRVEWDASNKSMKYAVCRGENKQAEISPIDGGTLAKLIEDRFSEGYPHYKAVWETLVAHLQKTYKNEPEATKIEIALTNKTSASVKLQSLENQPPWGFITLALDACTEFNKQLVENPPATLPEKFRERGIEIVTKNSSPEEPNDRPSPKADKTAAKSKKD